jgi:hypothetical protein
MALATSATAPCYAGQQPAATKPVGFSADRDCDPGATSRPATGSLLPDRAGNAQLQVRSGTGLGTISVVAEVPTDVGDEFSEPCTDAREPGERCIISNADPPVTSGLPGRLS